MVVVAVAGGTGYIGRTVVEAILAAGKHEVTILSRKPNPSLEAELGVRVIAIDYSDIEAVTKTLENNNVHTATSAITMFSMDGTVPKENELIRAADASKTTVEEDRPCTGTSVAGILAMRQRRLPPRMISSSWGVLFKPEHMGQFVSVIHKRNKNN